MKNKTCIKCKQELSTKMFYKSKITKDKIDYYCKECRKVSSLKSHRGGTRKPICSIDGCETFTYAKGFCRTHYSRWDRNGVTDLLNFKREVYLNGQTYEEVRRNHLMYAFKITLEKYQEMSLDGCEICGSEGYKHKKLHIDHDHKCCPVNYVNGRATSFTTCGFCVRGVLCNRCNAAVGRYEKGVMRDDYPLINDIINYVAKYNQLISDRIYTNGKIKETRRRQGKRSV